MEALKRQRLLFQAGMHEQLTSSIVRDVNGTSLLPLGTNDQALLGVTGICFS